MRTWAYGFDGSDETHNAVLNLTYALPRASHMAHDSKIVKFVLDEWMLSGIAQWVSGTPAAISLSTVQGTDLTGGRRRPARQHRGIELQFVDVLLLV